MPQYKVKNTSIMHNKKVYPEGSIIDLTEGQEKRLKDFLEILSNQKPTQTKNPEKTSNKTAKTISKSDQKVETKAANEKTEISDENKSTNNETVGGKNSD